MIPDYILLPLVWFCGAVCGFALGGPYLYERLLQDIKQATKRVDTRPVEKNHA